MCTAQRSLTHQIARKWPLLTDTEQKDRENTLLKPPSLLPLWRRTKGADFPPPFPS